MKKLYSIVLMAVALLVSTNMWATVHQAGSSAQLKTAWENAASGDEIQLTASFEIDKTLWLGTTAMNDDPMSITLNLNGDTLSSTAQKVFVLTHGSLNVIGNGGIKHNIPYPTNYNFEEQEYKSAYEIFRVLGSTYKGADYDAKTSDTHYTHLSIGKDVKLVASVNGIVVDQCKAAPATSANAWAAGGKEFPTWTDLYTNVYHHNKANQTTGDRGVANGVRIDVLGTIHATKYAIKANGNLGSTSLYPLKSYDNKYYQAPGVTYAVEAGDDQFSPYIVIGKTAELLTLKPERKDAVAAYSGGYARWYVEGSCIGSTGVYLKSGEIVLNDAVVASNYNGGDYTPAVETGSGVQCGGSGIVMQSSTAYAGDISVSIEGDTKVSGTSGYAIDEAVTATADSTKVDVITIAGGTFESGSEGTMRVTETTAIAAADPTQETIITIIGGNADNTSSSIGTQTLENYLAGQSDVHVTIVDDGKGGTTLVISEGSAPAVANSVIGATPNTSINWQNDVTKEETLTGDLSLKDLEINQAYDQKLTIPTGKTLTVERVILGANAKIIVEAGGKFIVTGNQGIVAPVVDNIVLKTEEGNPAIFLFHPSVTSNRHPMATVEFTSKSCYRYPAQKNIYQRFGIPMKKDGLASIEAQGNHETRFFVFDYVNAHDWVGIGYINPSAGYESQALDITKMNDPFEYYQLLDFVATTPTPGVIYTMKGNLLGNGEPTMDIIENSWKGFANSYMGNMKLSELLKLIPNTVDKAIYVYDVNAKFASWEPVSNLNSANQILNPMQPFLIRNRYEAAAVELDYEETVYKPTLGIASSPAPRRAVAENITMAKISIANENSADYVIVAESDEFTPAFDNGYDASKFMNDEANLYVMAEENMSIFATDELENTYLGVSSVLGGKYTMTFSNVSGEEFVLVDNMTGIQTVIAEGNSYEFTTDANSVNDYRFEIVSPRKVTTAIENAEAVKSAKGIYTITGQYMGEMNVWNSLPAGVYVVNGEKRVK